MKLEVTTETNLKIEQAQQLIIAAARSAMRDTVVAIHGDAMRLSPKKTGNNMRSIASEVSEDESLIKGSVFSTSGYGGWLEVGTAPHKISVKTAKVLTDGKTFFGKEVQHPGTAPHPYLKPALDMNFTPEHFAEKVEEYLK